MRRHQLRVPFETLTKILGYEPGRGRGDFLLRGSRALRGGPITRPIVLGLVLLTLSGIGWLLLGFGSSARLWVKLVLVAAIWALGPVIDNVVEPRFKRLAPEAGASVSPAFLRIVKQYMAWEAPPRSST